MNSLQSTGEMSISGKNIAIIPYSTLSRIKDKIENRADMDLERLRQEKNELHDKSKARVKHWPNTLEAKRKKRDDMRFDRFKKDEIERRKVDLEEEKYQAEEKRKVLEKANVQIFEQNDRVKAFKAKLLLSDAEYERDLQKLVNEKKKDIDKEYEDFYDNEMWEVIRKAEEKEKMKQMTIKKKKIEMQHVIREQHEQMKDRYVQKLQEEKIEGEIIKIKAQEAVQEELDKDEAKRKRHKLAIEEQKVENEKLKTIRLEVQRKEQLEEEKIKMFAKRKEEIMDMRKKREQVKFSQKQEERQKMIDIQIKRLEEMKSQEENRLNKQIVEAEIKAENAEKRKKEMKEALIKRIDRNVAIANEKKEEALVKLKEESENFQGMWKQKNNEAQSKEMAEIERKKAMEKKLHQFHVGQSNERQEQIEREFLDEIEEAERQKIFLRQKDEHFNSWAEKCINEWGNSVISSLKEGQEHKASAFGVQEFLKKTNTRLTH